MGLKKFYEDYCAKACGEHRPSERLCFKGVCHLKNFMESTLLKIPEETMRTISDTLHLMRLEVEIKQSRYGPALASLNIKGSTCSVVLDDRHGFDSKKARALNANEAAIITIYKIFTSASHIQEVKMECRINDQPEVVLQVSRTRAESLIGPEGMNAIKRDWHAIWDYLRPVVNQPEFAAEVKLFLTGATDQNPLRQARPANETSWLKRVFPR